MLMLPFLESLSYGLQAQLSPAALLAGFSLPSFENVSCGNKAGGHTLCSHTKLLTQLFLLAPAEPLGTRRAGHGQARVAWWLVTCGAVSLPFLQPAG
jgi:hypothetical protein